MLPAGQADQPGEVAKIEQRAREYIKRGLSPQDAVLDYSGVRINKEENKPLALQLVGALNTITKPIKGYQTEISRRINSGDLEGAKDYANKQIDTEVKAQYGDKAILNADVKKMNNIDRIIKLIDNNQDKIGAFDGRIADLLNKFVDQPGYQELKTLLTISQADTRKYFAGSAVTETEMKALEDFIGGKTSMNAENLKTQLRTIKDNTINNYNNQREYYGLDPIETDREKEVKAVQSMSREEQVNDILTNYYK